MLCTRCLVMLKTSVAVGTRNLLALRRICLPLRTVSIMSSSKFGLAKRLEGTDKNVWVEFGKLASECKAVNLGQGFPDFLPPNTILDALRDTMTGGNVAVNQYTRSFGHPRLVNALAKTYSDVMFREIRPLEEILVTIGAYGALYCAVQGLVNPGDEAIIIEPAFDCYQPMIRAASGKPVFVSLKPPKKQSGSVSSHDWILDMDELASKFTPKTKLIILNNPNNPLGKVYTCDELTSISNLCKQHDVVVIADEVYEWLVYQPNQHVKIATLPDMWERTITIGSAGKMFSATGWKLGWAIGPEYLIRCLQTSHQNCTYTSPTPLQEAVAVGLEVEYTRFDRPECYYNQLAVELKPKRDKIAKILSDVGMVPTIPEGGYFILADFSNLKIPFDESSSESKDYQFVKWLTINKKLASIPTSAFYCASHKHLGENLARFCFIKEDSTLDKAEEILKQWKSEM